MSKTFYTLAEVKSERGGHGEGSWDFECITKIESGFSYYKTFDFPPLFTTREKAEIYLKSKAINWPRYTIVPLYIYE